MPWAGRIVLSISAYPPLLLWFPAAAVSSAPVKGQSSLSPGYLAGKADSSWLSSYTGRNENEVRELIKMDETQAEGPSNSYLYFQLSAVVLPLVQPRTAELLQPDFSFP